MKLTLSEGSMSLSQIALALFLVVYGVITVFGIRFDHEAIAMGIFALIAGVLMFCRK